MTDKDKEFEAALEYHNAHLIEKYHDIFERGALWGRSFTLKEASEELEKAKAEIEKLKYVPGRFKCPKCGCGLLAQNLYIKSDTVGPNDKPQECPNECGPMWKLSWSDHCKSISEVADRTFETVSSKESMERLHDTILKQLQRAQQAELAAKDKLIEEMGNEIKELKNKLAARMGAERLS